MDFDRSAWETVLRVAHAILPTHVAPDFGHAVGTFSILDLPVAVEPMRLNGGPLRGVTIIAQQVAIATIVEAPERLLASAPNAQSAPLLSTDYWKGAASSAEDCGLVREWFGRGDGFTVSWLYDVDSVSDIADTCACGHLIVTLMFGDQVELDAFTSSHLANEHARLVRRSLADIQRQPLAAKAKLLRSLIEMAQEELSEIAPALADAAALFPNPRPHLSSVFRCSL